VKTNFANVRLPVRGDRLIGRDHVCRIILRAILSLQSCDLMGLRRIGKTSVLQEIERRLKEVITKDDVVLFADLSVFSSDDAVAASPETRFYEGLTRALDEELLDREGVNSHAGQCEVSAHSAVFNSVYIAPGATDQENAFEFFMSFLTRYYRKTGARVFVLVDEFDSCCTYGTRLSGFLRRFRYLVDSSAKTGFVSVVATSRSITMLESKTNGDASTLHNVLEHADLTCFGREVFEELCDLSETQVPSQMRDKMFECSFGHPFLATVLLHHFNRLAEEGATDIDFECIRVCAHSDFEDYFHELRKVFSSFAVDQEVVSSGIENWFDCLVWHECYQTQIPQHVRATFVRFGFWRDNRNLPSVVREFLARHRTDIWQELRSLETRFRRMIDRQLSDYYGCDDWFEKMRLPEYGSLDDPWRNEKKPFQEIVRGMRARRQKEQPDLPVSYLECTYLDDLLNLMLVEWHWKPDANRKWKGFGILFDGDVAKCREQLLAAGKVRNPEAHFVEYPVVLKARFQEANRYLSAILDRAEREMQV